VAGKGKKINWPKIEIVYFFSSLRCKKIKWLKNWNSFFFSLRYKKINWQKSETVFFPCWDVRKLTDKNLKQFFSPCWNVRKLIDKKIETVYLFFSLLRCKKINWKKINSLLILLVDFINLFFYWKKNIWKFICGTFKLLCFSSGFPGSQPVSMDINNLDFLRRKEYKVSWKADGTR
jgi:hypothetical protein